MRILLIDDDEQLMEALAGKLIAQHYAVDLASTAAMGWEFIQLFDFDLVVLDWMLPDLDGVSLCQQLRAKGYRMPIILLSARDRHRDKVMALDTGADDYIVKPFNFDELTARIRVLLRREVNLAAPILQWHELSLDPRTYEVRCQQQLLPLTPKEYGIIELLMRHPQRVFSPRAIIDNLWAGEDIPGEEAVRTHIKGLRHKLQSAGVAKDTIKTVYGVGYRLQSDEERQQGKSAVAAGKTKREAAIASTWKQFQDVAFHRVADLENLLQALAAKPIHPSLSEIQHKARNSAHKLAGSLGCFGFTRGSILAKQLQQLLDNNLLRDSDTERVSELVTALRRELSHQSRAETAKIDSHIALLLVAADADLSYQLVNEARHRESEIYPALNLDRAREILATQSKSIDAVLFKITFPDNEALAFLQQLHQQLPQIPIIAITESARLLDRLEIVRSGVSLILQHPVEPKVAIDAAIESLQSAGQAAKVLIVDDDPEVLQSLAISLQPWGFQLTTLKDSKDFWDVLVNVEPDLLVLDIEMPGIDGIELCQILRSDRRWQQLPILFLSAHREQTVRERAFAAGADDYICKPVTGSLLANRILNRLQRSRGTMNSEQ